MQFFRVALIVCAFTWMPSPSLVAGSHAMVVGEGGVSCGAWTEERQGKTFLADVLSAWVRGFVSAINLEGSSSSGHITEGIDNSAVEAWIDNYCTSNPLDTLALATVALTLELRARQLGKQNGN